jgi:hypothetical protein
MSEDAEPREPKRRRLTNAERQAEWRLRHQTKPFPPLLAPSIRLDRLANSAKETLAVYDRLVKVIGHGLGQWEHKELTFSELLMAFRLLGPALESLAAMRATIIEQRGNEAHDITPLTPETQADHLPQIQDKTMELLRDRFVGIVARGATLARLK